jgi:hypothetical protein
MLCLPEMGTGEGKGYTHYNMMSVEQSDVKSAAGVGGAIQMAIDCPANR